MTSQIKVQGSFKSVAFAALAAVASVMSMSAEAARPTTPVAPRPGVVRPPIRLTPPTPVIVVPPCKRGGAGVTPC